MNLTATVDLSGLEEMLSAANIKRAQLILAEQVGTDCNEIVPKETGTLRGSMTVESDGVTWEAFNARGDSYAEYVYNMGDVNYTTPGTHGDWLEYASREHLDDWAQAVGEALVED